MAHVLPAASGADVTAAGALVLRAGGEVLLVHRPKYDDWAFPKGKQEPHEHVAATAVREVLEETGVRIRLGRPLPRQLYRISGGRAKTVHYWVGRAVSDDDLAGYQANHEIDRVGWFPQAKARRKLTYAKDAELLDQLVRVHHKTAALVILRHGKARARGRWQGADEERPLTGTGRRQAQALVPVLAAYGIDKVVSSDSTRCVQTVAQYAASRGRSVEQYLRINEEAWTETAVGMLLDELVAAKQSAAVCTHRPVLPAVFAHLGLTEEPLDPAELVVCHLRKGQIVATERHRVC